MANFFDKLTSGISSNTGSVQSDAASGFRLINPNGPRPVTLTNQLDFNSESVKALVQQSFQAGQELANQEPSIRRPNAIDPVPAPAAIPGANPYGVRRDPWIFATFKDVVDGALDVNNPNSIVWYANPKSVTWSINQRAVETKTKAGTVLHVWRDRQRKTDFDDPKINITFQSGSIIPGFADAQNPNGLQGVPDQPLPPGLNNFFQFMQLVDSSKIYKGQANLVHILYRSRIFPHMMLTGFFDPQAIVTFTDTADNPFQVNSWTATFTIYQTVPAFNNWSKLKQMFEQEFANSDPFNKSLQGPVTTSGIPDMTNIGRTS